MDKILVEIYIPGMNQSYDVYLPLTTKIHEVNGLLTHAFKELAAGYFIPSDTVLCDKATGQIFDINKSVFDLGLKNGSKLMLI